MKNKPLAISSIIAATCPALFAVSTVTDDFESYSTGGLPGAAWSSPSADFSVGTANGLSGSQGLDIANTSGGGARTLNKTGLAGDSFELSSRMQITINDLAPTAANHSTFGLWLSDTPDWWSGSNYNLVLSRRDAGQRYGVNMTGKGLVGWENNSEIGLPNTLPTVGNTATSQWFEMKFSMSDNGDGTWATEGFVYDDSGTEVFTTSGSITLASGATTLYGGYFVDWGNAPAIQTGAIDTVSVDAFNLTAVPEPSVFALGGLAFVAFVIRRRRS